MLWKYQPSPRHCYGVAQIGCLLNLPWAWSGGQHGTGVLLHRSFECGHPTTPQGGHELFSKSWETTLGTCDMLIRVWFRVPHPQSCKQGPLGLGPALALLTAGLEHPEAERVRSEAYESSSEDFGCACCQDNVATLTHKVPCGRFLPHCLFTELFTLACLPQQSASPFVVSRLVPIQLPVPKTPVTVLPLLFSMAIPEMHPFQKGLCSPVPI